MSTVGDGTADVFPKKTVRTDAFGAVGDGRTNDTRALQRAIDYAANTRTVLVVPAATYSLVPETEFHGEPAEAYKIALTLRSNLSIEAEAGAVFKIADDVSTDALPQPFAMFATNAALENIVVTGLDIDMNGARNPISPKRPATRAGTISVALNGTTVTGSGTRFRTDGSLGGLIFIDAKPYRIAAIASDTQLTISFPALDAVTDAPYRMGEYNRFTQAAILVSGTPNGEAARCSNVRLERCTFRNTAGVSSIVMAQTNALDGKLGGSWTLRDCEFLNNGLDTDDHSSVFGWAEDVLVDGNVFLSEHPYGPPHTNTHYEIHGARQKIINNHFSGGLQGLWVAENYTRDATDILIQANMFDNITSFAIQAFGQLRAARPTHGVRIIDNTIILDDAIYPGIGLKAGVAIASPHAQRDWEIIGNTVKSSGTTVGTAAVLVSAGKAGEKHDNILIERNAGEGLVYGVALRTSDVSGLGTIVARGNRWQNLTAAGSYRVAAGESIGHYGQSGQPIDHLVVEGNECMVDRGSSGTPATSTNAQIAGPSTRC